MDINNYLETLLEELKQVEEVEGILLAGSHTNGTSDVGSDYDIYVYSYNPVPVEARRNICSKYFKYIEINNTFWEIEDDGYLFDGVPVELIYRELNWIEGSLNRTVIDCQADVGYTTCFWGNFVSSIILYDKSGILSKLQEKYTVSYPEQLKINIINKNYPLLKAIMPAYYHQIAKALTREDYISINHRVAAFFASYFDILFALNECLHPGEKKLIRIAKEKLSLLPDNFETDINNILKSTTDKDNTILKHIDSIIENLSTLLREKGYL